MVGNLMNGESNNENNGYEKSKGLQIQKIALQSGDLNQIQSNSSFFFVKKDQE